ncbi:MAG: aldehyde dehydrogenase family protein [Anaerolineales bacterium]|jgi:acyl-CoA reductase-like NAD-dependent aldehyde dehydrogenase|nr:aldehyde dehydrogenase family protein [Anaerolineales bacterium]
MTSKRLDVRKTHKLFIGGSFPRSESGRTFRWESPDGAVANICRASRKDFRDAVTASRGAFRGWTGRTSYNRAQILYRCAEMLEGRSSQFHDELRLQGASPSAARKEVARAIDLLIYYAGWADKYGQIFSRVNPVAAPYFNFTVPEATGVVAVFAPSESGLLGLLAALTPVITGGNTCVVLAARDHPLCAVSLAETLHTADLPAGVVNLLTGFRAELLEPFATHMDVNALVYFGDDIAEIAQAETSAAENVKRVAVCGRADWEGADALNPYAILRTQETKTTWHPIGF